MRRWPRIASAATLLAAVLAVSVPSAVAAGEPSDPRVVVGGAHGQAPTHGRPSTGFARPGGSAATVPPLTWHGGAVRHGTTVQPIYWGSSWSNATFVGDKRTGLQSFYQGIGGSTYAGSNTEYYDGSGHVSTAVAWGGDLVDTSAGPKNAPTTSSVFSEVLKATGGHLTPGAYYPVYVDTPRGTAGYCAWHSSATYNGVTVEFGFFFNLDGDPGCNPGDTSTTHSQGLSALANVSGHELSETLTDPQLNAWYDRQGAENADKCAWTFNGVSTFNNGTQWLIQGNWSNNAYNNRSGFGISKGCIL